MKLHRVARLPAPLEDVWTFFSDPANLAEITPSSMGFQIVSAPDRPIRQGDVISYRLKVAGIPIRWVSRITELVEGEMFVDLQEQGPYALWHHRHVFRQTTNGTEMIDDVDYELPFGIIGKLGGSLFVKAQLSMIFGHRARTIERIFESNGESLS